MNADHVAIECEHDESERAARRIAAWVHTHPSEAKVERYAWEWKTIFDGIVEANKLA